jgi:copper(I)-binding protein
VKRPRAIGTTLAGAPARAAGLAVCLVLAGCSTSGTTAGDGVPELKVTGAYIPQPVTDDMAAGYLVVTNDGDTADRLTNITSDFADDITIHRTEDQRMKKVASFDIPAHGELDLERGANHIMFTKLTEKLRQGETVPVELHFEKADAIKVDIPVKETTYRPKHD